MKTMNFEEMEQTQAQGCGAEAAWGLLSIVGLAASAGGIFTVGLGLVTAGKGIYDYYACLDREYGMFS